VRSSPEVEISARRKRVAEASDGVVDDLRHRFDRGDAAGHLAGEGDALLRRPPK
jgi:hypothetical protein